MKCVDCLDITTISSVICDHCDKEFCSGCFPMHNMELEEERTASLQEARQTDYSERYQEWADSMIEIDVDTEVDQWDYILSEQEKEENGG